MKSDLVDVFVAIHHRTEKAVLVSLDGERSKAVWLPLSQIEIEERERDSIVTMPERLAIEKGLV
jgi:hypothetical protein